MSENINHNKPNDFKINEIDIDLVYTWVDGSDSEWLESKKKYMTIEKKDKKKSKNSITSNRYRNLDELKYSLRTVVNFLPFIRKIYIVTNGQRPSWLKLDDKIELITHEQIFPKPPTCGGEIIKDFYLPTFNSIAIEANLHRIPGLSEYFIYLNDDVFIGQPMKREHFLDEKGRTKVYLREGKFVPKREKFKLTDYYFRDGLYHTHKYLNKYSIKRIKRMTHQHVGIMLRKSVLQNIEEQLKSTDNWLSSLTRFRQNQNIMLISLFYQYYSLDNDFAINDNEVSCYRVSDEHEVVLGQILKKKYHMFCLNTLKENTPELMKFYNILVPNPSPYEIVTNPEITANVDNINNIDNNINNINNNIDNNIDNINNIDNNVDNIDNVEKNVDKNLSQAKDEFRIQ